MSRAALAFVALALVGCSEPPTKVKSASACEYSRVVRLRNGYTVIQFWDDVAKTWKTDDTLSLQTLTLEQQQEFVRRWSCGGLEIDKVIAP